MNFLDLVTIIFAIGLIVFYFKKNGLPKISKNKSYTVSEDGAWLWIRVSKIPKHGIEDGDYRELSLDGYQKRIPNTLFNRHRNKLKKIAHGIFFLLTVLAPTIMFVFAGQSFGWNPIVYQSLAYGALVFQLYFLSELEEK